MPLIVNVDLEKSVFGTLSTFIILSPKYIVNFPLSYISVYLYQVLLFNAINSVPLLKNIISLLTAIILVPYVKNTLSDSAINQKLIP